MNNNESNIRSGERLTFFKLFNEKKIQIEIPIIQRDYAQGRNSSLEIREMFLDALLKYLEENKPDRDLDFIYGSLKNNGDTIFIPLDGQQRLTTLFLLHWYLANISGEINNYRQVILTEEGKSKFTYETRASSKEFCDALISNDIDISKLLKPDRDKQNSLSKTIQDSGWYYLSWENDPTIQSMLTMLDSIHEKFSGKTGFYQRLTDKDNPVITFLFLNLKEFALTDDLYIKMNSRGKPLTSFENFKAKFEQYIGNLDWESATPYRLIFGEDEQEVSMQKYFSHKIDTDWANLFWVYRNVNGKDNSFDDELMNFIRVILANQYAVDSKKENDENLEFLIGTQVARKKKNYTDNITYHRYNHFGVLTKNAISYLIDALDKLSNGDSIIQSYLSDAFYYDEQNVFENVLRHNLTLPQRVQFHAYIKFLINNNGNTEGIAQWMRVIHNLTQNTIIDGADEVARAIKSIENMLPYSSQILDSLKDDNVQVDFFYGRQIQEEKIKAHLLNISGEWKKAIEDIEKNSFFAGQIGFLLEFSGILAWYEENGDCNWTDEKCGEFLETFNRYSENAKATFNYVENENQTFLWERAVLSKGDYLIDASSSRRNFLSTKRNTRDFSWKRLLRLPPSSDTGSSDVWRARRNFIKKVFDDEHFSPENFEQSLQEIIKTKPDDWRKHFIKHYELIEYCEQGFIRISDSSLLLYKQSQHNHYHAELYSYLLYLKFNKIDMKPFTNKWYFSVRGSEETPCVVLDNWQYDEVNYAISISYLSNTNKFEIIFFNRNGDIDKAIVESLKNDDKTSGDYSDNSYIILKDKESEVLSHLNTLCKTFNVL